MSVCEKQLARYREVQEHKRRNMGSKHHRTQLIKSLEQQLAATTDPKLKADVSRQLTKLLSKPRARRLPSNPTKVHPIMQPGRLSKRVKKGSAVDELSDARWL